MINLTNKLKVFYKEKWNNNNKVERYRTRTWTFVILLFSLNVPMYFVGNIATSILCGLWLISSYFYAVNMGFWVKANKERRRETEERIRKLIEEHRSQLNLLDSKLN